MITLRQIAVTHIDRFSGGDRKTGSELSIQDIVLKARGICNELLKTEYIGKMTEGDRSAITNCIATYQLTLLNDGQSAYVILPDFYLSLPYNRGVHRIFQYAKKAKGEPTETDFTLAHFPAVNLKTRTARKPGLNMCWIEGYKLKFYKVYAEPDKTNTINVQLIVAAPDSIGEDDPLPIPPELVIRVYDRLAQMELNPGLEMRNGLTQQ